MGPRHWALSSDRNVLVLTIGIKKYLILAVFLEFPRETTKKKVTLKW